MHVHPCRFHATRTHGIPTHRFEEPRNRLAPNRSIPPFPVRLKATMKNRAEGGFLDRLVLFLSRRRSATLIILRTTPPPLFIYSPSFSLSHPLLFLTTVSSSCLEPLDIRRKCAARRLRLVTALPSSFDRSTRKNPIVLFAMSSTNRINVVKSKLSQSFSSKKYPSSTFPSILSIIPNVDSSN